ncbi:four-helix bundle copper-binding protein [Parerythrobacter lacustris]|uniref:Four-helix bundle copper-binding protein n=1 Tax=Parerythrobacter lacustris TaxID=2969984 RepID=A0ABT1XTK3_9SPHN|nr:four-helix bundle copper-binding protein [Parerythrobacter lacustris]MCR2834968.1 four-helix bundle copper-binding protein [Parerythrobacter lacustris]
MSIKEMIKEHPQVGADWNEDLGEAVKHAMYCAAICNSCADACSAEEMDMRTCIRLCMDCADICTATYRVASRRTSGNVGVIESMLRTCIAACEACVEECEKHDTDHCRRCARMCRECADDCTKALEGMLQHA